MDRRSFITASGLGAVTSTASDATASSPPEHPFSGIDRMYAITGRNRAKLTSSLVPWSPSTEHPWDVKTINHLYRRLGFGASKSEINVAQAKSPHEVIDSLLDNALIGTGNLPVDPRYSEKWLHVTPYLGLNYDLQLKQQADYSYANMEIRRHWTVQMGKPGTMLREKLTLFWMNHFVVEEIKVYYPQMMYRYLDYFRRNAWGNFKQMTKDVTIEAAMLVYLDGATNIRGVPNENYARELLELFTLGVLDKDNQPNYTEDDIRAIAKALTGYRIDLAAPAPDVVPAVYDVNRHDATFKQVFEDKANGIQKQYGLATAGVEDDIIEAVFAQRPDKLAWYICSKLYQYFVYYDISGDTERLIIDQMAATFKANNWELKPVLAELFKSEHFFDNANIGAAIKSPYEFLVGSARSFNIELDELQSGSLYFYSALNAQVLLNPPDVKGWPGYHSWISTTTLPYRNTLGYTLCLGGSLPAQGSDGYGNQHSPLTLTNEALTIWAKQFISYDGGSIDNVIEEMSAYLCAQMPSQVVLDYIKQVVTGGSAYDWSKLNDATKITPIRVILTTITNTADYQLC